MKTIYNFNNSNLNTEGGICTDTARVWIKDNKNVLESIHQKVKHILDFGYGEDNTLIKGLFFWLCYEEIAMYYGHRGKMFTATDRTFENFMLDIPFWGEDYDTILSSLPLYNASIPDNETYYLKLANS